MTSLSSSDRVKINDLAEMLYFSMGAPTTFEVRQKVNKNLWHGCGKRSITIYCNDATLKSIISISHQRFCICSLLHTRSSA